MLAKIFKKNMDVWYHDILKLFQASDRGKAIFRQGFSKTFAKLSRKISQ